MNRIVSLALLSVCLAFSMSAGDVQLPRKAPELAFTLPGEGESLLSQYRGKVVALTFILTTCPHCQAESHVLTKLQQEFGARGLQCLALAINALDEGRTAADAAQTVQAFASQFQVGFPVGFVPRDAMVNFMSFSLADRFVVPQIILIDRTGMIHYQTPALGDEHSQEEDVIRGRLQELLALPDPGAAHRTSKAKMVKRAS